MMFTKACCVRAYVYWIELSPLPKWIYDNSRNRTQTQLVYLYRYNQKLLPTARRMSISVIIFLCSHPHQFCQRFLAPISGRSLQCFWHWYWLFRILWAHCWTTSDWMWRSIYHFGCSVRSRPLFAESLIPNSSETIQKGILMTVSHSSGITTPTTGTMLPESDIKLCHHLSCSAFTFHQTSPIPPSNQRNDFTRARWEIRSN